MDRTLAKESEIFSAIVKRKIVLVAQAGAMSWTFYGQACNSP